MNELMARIYKQGEFINHPSYFTQRIQTPTGWQLPEKPVPERWTFEDAFAYYHQYVLGDIGRPWFDEQNAAVIELLLYYFTNDKRFYDLAASLEIKGAELQKGLLICGNVGRGKTFLLHLFAINQRQPYKIFSAKIVANAYEKEGVEAVEQFDKKLNKSVNLFGSSLRTGNEHEYFHYSTFGLCIDDMGTEDLKMYMGNRRNVIGDIIENRYANGCMGKYFHATSNLTFEQIEQYYGERVSSRIRQTMNVIVLTGEDRRKTVAIGGSMNTVASTNEKPKKAKLGTSEARMEKAQNWSITGAGDNSEDSGGMVH